MLTLRFKLSNSLPLGLCNHVEHPKKNERVSAQLKIELTKQNQMEACEHSKPHRGLYTVIWSIASAHTRVWISSYWTEHCAVDYVWCSYIHCAWLKTYRTLECSRYQCLLGVVVLWTPNPTRTLGYVLVWPRYPTSSTAGAMWGTVCVFFSFLSNQTSLPNTTKYVMKHNECLLSYL